jgi:hypothetical protein
MSKPYLGIWIDHGNAKIIQVQEGHEPVSTTIESLVEPRHRTTGQTGVPLPGHLGCNTESHDRNRRDQELNRFYDRVIAEIPDHARLIVLGPGEAKRELMSRMERTHGSRVRVMQTETTSSRLTDRQIVERVRRMAESSTSDKPAKRSSELQSNPTSASRSGQRSANW